jgi:hypothetical protein
VTAVLEGEHPLLVQLPGPGEHALVTLVPGLDGHLRDCLTGGLGSRRGVGLLVWINTHYDHLLGPPFRRANRRDGKDPPADTPQSGHVSGRAPIRSRWRASARWRGTYRMKVIPRKRKTPMLWVTPSPGSRLDGESLTVLTLRA